MAFWMSKFYRNFTARRCHSRSTFGIISGTRSRGTIIRG
jgi:hypothetical protein